MAKKGLIQLNLRTRIYFTMLALIMISFVLTGVTAYYNFTSQNKAYNKERFRRKEKQVKQAMTYFLQQQGGYIAPNDIQSSFEDKIYELHDIHGIHITLFDLFGARLVSSLPEEQTPQKIEYTIFKQLSTGNDRAQSELEIENTPSILAFWYFTTADGRPMAITNVTYDKTEVNKEELSSFLIQLTQIYIVLFVGAAILAFFLSNYITRSLQSIGRKMKEIRVGEKNDPIEWKSDDEIGALVKEYNRMLMEVDRSADKLAKSERELAWREMAKQVAHEIKNPLTPMRLRVQHLQRAWADQADNFDQRLETTSQTLIEQIDTLSHIADEFSNFAKMPKARNEALNLIETLRSAHELFSETKRVRVEFSTALSEAMVMADKSQLQRVFTNLIKNAVQAIPEDREGLVSLTLTEEGRLFKIEVEDNGKGIPAEDYSRIFVPNFTTKSTGTGLGLAMVRNIVENAGGDISFTSKVDHGTTFTVRLPRQSAD